MSPNDVTSRPPLSAWQSQGLRLTAFPSTDGQVSEHDWWAEVVGEPPEKVTSQPRTGVHIEEGFYGVGKLVLGIHPIRIDWRWNVAEESSMESRTIPTLGSFLEVLADFQNLMTIWLGLENIPPLKRLAFGGVLLQPVESGAQGYDLLSAYLPFRLDSRDSSDFMYQINRRRNAVTPIPGLKINRLTKWAVLQVQLGVISATAPMFLHSGPSLYACQLELDINTIAEIEGELPRERLVELFNELIALGKEIASEGDIS